MSKKIIITESQLNMVIRNIHEGSVKETMVEEIFTFLKDNYEPTKGTYKQGGEYHETGMLVNKTNDEVVSVKSVFQYIKYKFDNVSDEFIKQVITDFMKGNITKDFQLSTSVSMK